MNRSRTVTALVGVIVSLVLSAALYVYTGSVLFFLLVPFVPFLFTAGRTTDSEPARETKQCGRCGFRTEDVSFEYCPYDGSRLYESSDNIE